MRIRELTFLPTGEILSDASFDTADLARDALDHYERWWRAAESPVTTAAVETPGGSLTVKFTFGSEGGALATWLLAGVPVLSALLLAGIDPGNDAALTAMFRNSMRNVKHVTQPPNGEAPFERIQQVTDHPLAAGVFWPFTPLKEYRRALPTIRLMTAAFFRARPTGGAEGA